MVYAQGGGGMPQSQGQQFNPNQGPQQWYPQQQQQHQQQQQQQQQQQGYYNQQMANGNICSSFKAFNFLILFLLRNIIIVNFYSSAKIRKTAAS